MSFHNEDDRFHAEPPNQPQINELQAYQTENGYTVAVSWQRGEENNSDLDFYEVSVGDVSTTRVKDTQDVVIVSSSPPENMLAEVRIIAISKCGARSAPASATTAISSQ